MGKNIVMIVWLLAALVASAGVTTHLGLDCRKGVRTVPSAGADLLYDAGWYEGGRTVRLTDNAEVIESGSSGAKHWMPADYQIHCLRMVVVDGEGEQVGGEVAYFKYVPSDGAVVIPDDWTEIPADTFKDCDWLTSITIPNSVTKIAPTAFVGCSNIVSVTMNNVEAFTSSALLHRWSFNGNLKDSVGGVDATVVGNVTTDGRQYSTPGGSSGSAYIDLGDNLVPKDCKAVTLEFWATQDSWGSYDRIFDFGSMPAGYDFTRRDTRCYSSDNIRMGWEGNITSFGAGGWSLSVGTEYHIAVVYVEGANERWEVVYYIQPADGGSVTKVACEADEGWSFSQVGQTEWLLGQPLTCWDSCARLSYDEVRITGEALTEEDFVANTLAGPDGLKVTGRGFRLIFPDSNVREVCIGESITSLPAGIFAGCASLESVTILSGVRNIGEDAFVGCENLKRVDVGSVVDWVKIEFENELANPLNLGALLYVNGEEYAESYDSLGFNVIDGWICGYRNREATSVDIPECTVGIGRGAFSDMSNLESIQFHSTVRYIAPSAFENDYFLDNVVIPNSVETIRARAFKNCTELTSLKFGTALKSVEKSSFENCISIEKVEFEEGIESIGARAFASDLGSMRLKSVSLPASLRELGEGAFDGCDMLTGVTVPTHLKTMVEIFPDSYKQIESVVIPEGVTKIVDRMFKGCRALKSVVIPNTVVSIGESAFEECGALVEIGIPNSVMVLGKRAFGGCTNLQTVALSTALEVIEDCTFENCPRLDSLVIPASVKTLGSKIYSGGDIYSPTTVFFDGVDYWNDCYKYYGDRGWWENPVAYYRFFASLTGIYFLGDAPTVQSDTYEGVPSEAKSYVVKGSKGWYLAGSPTLPPDGWPTCGNARAITYWTPNRFDVTFDGNGGTPEAYAAEQITDTTYSLPKTNPTRTGYLFDGWWTEPKAGAQIYWNTRVTATKAHTLYAHWKSLKDGITVIFNPNGGTVSPDEVEYPAGVTYGELPVPTRIGHEFLGWYTSQVGGDLVTEATEVHKENNELYAHWRPITYWVVFDANGGYGTMERQLHTYNEAKTLLANQYYLNGFKFTGWAETRGGAVKYADQKEVENLAEIQDQEVTLYAVWNGASYAVRFDGNGGTGSMENQTFVVGVSQGLAECQYTRTGYAFAGWATTPAGTVAYKDKEDVKNLTMTSGATVNLYAVWTPIQYLISYNANGGGGAMSATVAIYDEEVVLPESAFSWAGHRFVGWAMEADGEVVYEAGQRVQNLASQSGVNVILYAVWELEQVAMPTVSPADGTVFETSCKVTLACSTVGASIYYRVGAQPKATDRFKYTQPFEISETSVIYAFAKLGELQSETICVTLTKGEVLTFAKAVNAVGVETFELGGDDVWKVIETDGAKFDADCVQSGEIGDNQTSWFKATVQGAGTIRFWWKASCEEDLLKDFDHLVFVIDGHEFGRLDGITDWIEMLIPVQTTGTHTLMWAYVKDDGLAEGDDCGWVDGISWEPLVVVDPIPEINPNADAKAVQAALEGSTDARLAENITDAATYNAYREWALKIGAADVKASPFAWASFATDSAALLAKMPTDDDLKVEEFKPSAAAGSFDFTVSVKDVTVGDKASVDNLKKLFGLEGAESLDAAAFSFENVSLDFKEPQDGKLKFTATPAVDNAKSFFMKAKVK